MSSKASSKCEEKFLIIFYYQPLRKDFSFTFQPMNSINTRKNRPFSCISLKAFFILFRSFFHTLMWTLTWLMLGSLLNNENYSLERIMKIILDSLNLKGKEIFNIVSM